MEEFQDMFGRRYKLTPSGRLNLIHESWSRAVFGEQNFNFKPAAREPTESEKAHVAEIKRACGVT